MKGKIITTLRDGIDDPHKYASVLFVRKEKVKSW